jgi:hypothetical protein
MKLNKLILTAVIAVATSVLFAGCERNKGPAEKAGAEIDKTVEQAGQKMEDMGEKIQDKANN